MEDREKELASCFDAVEVDLTLLGATGVEDQLQEEVQETLESLKIAGIKVTIFITIFLHDLIINIFSRYGC
jgi:magnesium-transporting ATPase (P-type)